MTQYEWKIDAQVIGPFATNHYLLQNQSEKRCWLFDSGFDADGIVRWIEQSGCVLQEIYITHGHIDHVSAVGAVAKHYGVPYWMHAEDIPLTESLEVQGQMFGVSVVNPPAPDHLIESGTFLLDDLVVETRLTPGHSPGGVCFYFEDLQTAIVGDTIFQSSIGRTDLPGGSHPLLINSIKSQILSLPDETTLLPGHMCPTTVAVERASNPFLVG